MKSVRFALLFVVLLFGYISVAYSQGLFLFGTGKGGGGGGGASISLTDFKTDTSNTTTVSYGTPNIGPTGANRVIVLAIYNRNTTGGLTTVTVNGVTANQVSGAASASTYDSTDIWYITDTAAGVTGATTASVSVTYPAAAQRSTVAVYRLTTATPTPSAGAQQTAAASSTSISQNIAVPANGASIGVAVGRPTGSLTGTSWTGQSIDYDQLIAGVDEVTGAHSIATGTVTYKANFSAASTTQIQMSLASWGP